MNQRTPRIEDVIPDVRDGLTRLDRTVLFVLNEARRERQDGWVPTAMLYGRVLEYVNISEAELQASLQRLGVSS
ncbi:MAG: hypothetical protein MI794_14440 [Pseudomonadales bacterium]|nr:hypothetical protein [Pseudomonadales bacterium]